MNIPSITKALELDDADWDLAVKLRGLTEHQREQFSAALGPAKSSKKSTKKPAGKGGGGKSKHASSLQQQIGGTGSSLIRPPAAATIVEGDDDNSGRCQAKRSDNRICMLLPDHNIHHLPTAMDYHEFVAPPAAHAATGD